MLWKKVITCGQYDSHLMVTYGKRISLKPKPKMIFNLFNDFWGMGNALIGLLTVTANLSKEIFLDVIRNHLRKLQLHLLLQQKIMY